MSDSDSFEGFGPAVPEFIPPQEDEKEDLKLRKRKRLEKRRRIRVREENRLHLGHLPSAKMYEQSYLHREFVSVVCFLPKYKFLLTASFKDNILKFWTTKTQKAVVEYVKTLYVNVKHHFQFISLLPNYTESLCLLLSRRRKTELNQITGECKLVDVKNLDVLTFFSLDFNPNEGLFLDKSPYELLFSEFESTKLHLYSNEFVKLRVVELHSHPIQRIQFRAKTLLTTDSKGHLNFWNSDLTSKKFSWNYKMDTDYFVFSQNNCKVISSDFTEDNAGFFCSDLTLYLFDLDRGKIIYKFKEDLENLKKQQMEKAQIAFNLDHIDFTRRLAKEKEVLHDLEQYPAFFRDLLKFDRTGRFFVYSSLVGIKIVDAKLGELVFLLAKHEQGERFLNLSWDDAGCLAACAFQSRRFFLFTRLEPDLDPASSCRDVFNEIPNADERMLQQKIDVVTTSGNKFVSPYVKIFTNFGDIKVKLYTDLCPKTCENFTTLAQRKYYNSTRFHRVIKGFMIQGGDPTGTGTGGESIFGKTFEDELHNCLKHDRPFTLSMANCGPNTNGSQFFITTVSCPFLDGKHTVFGRVVEGAEVVTRIENVPCDKNEDRPLRFIEIISIVPSSE